MIRIDLSKQECMIALPFHPSNAYTIHELQADPVNILKKVEEDAHKRYGDKIQIDLASKVKDGKVVADQALIAGCSGGTYDNLSEAATILKGKNIGNDYFISRTASLRRFPPPASAANSRTRFPTAS